MMWCLAALCASAGGKAAGDVSAELLRACQAYLVEGEQEQAGHRKGLAEYSGPIDPVLQALREAEPHEWQRGTGRMLAEHFVAPQLRERYRDDLLYFYVPPEYDTTESFGLLIFMHGGGPGTPREYAQVVVNTPEQGRSYHLRPAIDHAPFITVAPSALVDDTSDTRWNKPEADDYIAAVIRECCYRFNIDIDRVLLGGWSMGGFGAYHQCQRLSDRIAGGVAGAGSWKAADWRSMVGTPLFIIHGAHDAVAPGTPEKAARPRYTDVFYARAADKLLTGAKADHVYAEYDGGHHPRDAGDAIQTLLAWATDRRRDPLYPRVVAVTPRGMDARTSAPSPHTRWVSILEIGDGRIPLDAVINTGPGPKWGEDLQSFNQQGLELVKTHVKGGLVEARYQGNNAFEVRTENVLRLSLWLHAKMVDFNRPVVVTLNGVPSEHEVRPTLLDALRSYKRRGDWGLIYHCELQIDVR